MKSITKLSPAKINLTLDVKSKTPGADFHELETIYHLVGWGDTITVEPSETFEIIGNFNCPLEDNLIYKAWEIMQQSTPPSLPYQGRSLPCVKVTVDKQIPTGGGLGGGSSNAATFVQAYFELFKLGTVPATLIEQLGTLGKDIPFFFHSEPCALGTGFGEVIEPVDFNFSGQPIYLYFPPFKSDTPKAYAALKRFDTNYTQQFLAAPKLENCGNTFKYIFEQNTYSELNLSGSGSTWFSFEKLDIPEWKIIETSLL